MKIHGLQKMTLLDFPGRVACTVFLGGCDFRCPFCHNYELIDGTMPPVMEEEELLSFLQKRRGLLDGVAITGGEPTLHPGLPALIREIRALGYAVKLDTNGYHPEVLETLLAEGLVDYVAMDIKNSPEKYPLTCGIERVDLDRIRQSISLLMKGPADYEFRTTAVAELHVVEDFRRIGELIRGARRYFIQCFTDREAVPFQGLHAPTREQMADFAAAVRPFVPDTNLRGID